MSLTRVELQVSSYDKDFYAGMSWQVLCVLLALPVLLALFLYVLPPRLERMRDRNKFWETVAQLRENNSRFQRDLGSISSDKLNKQVKEMQLHPFNQPSLDQQIQHIKKLDRAQQEAIILYITAQQGTVLKCINLASAFRTREKNAILRATSEYFEESKKTLKSLEEVDYLTARSMSEVMNRLCNKLESLR